MTLYEVLGVGPAADETTLHQAYVALARRHHPDRVGGDSGRMQAINEAWATLSDPVRRARYDRGLVAGASTVPRPAGPVSDAVDEDDFDDLGDDTPLRATVALPRWLSLLPIATFALSVVSLCFALMMASSQLFGLAVMTFALSCLFFLAAPFVALYSSRRPNADDRR